MTYTYLGQFIFNPKYNNGYGFSRGFSLYRRDSDNKLFELMSGLDGKIMVECEYPFHFFNPLVLSK